MGISVIVKRAPADFQGGDITDPLIATRAQAIVRGKAEIDKQCSNRVMVSGQCIFMLWMEPGKIVEVDDPQNGKYKGMLRSFARTSQYQGDGKFEAKTNITIEREEIK